MTPRTTTARLLCGLALVAGPVALTACGSNDKGSSGSTTSSSSGSDGGYGYGSSTATTTTTTSTTGGGSSKGASTVELHAQEHGGGHMSFDKPAYSAKAGKVTIRMSDPSSDSLSHGIEIEGNGVERKGSVVAPGGTSTITVSLKPGTYDLYCPVPGHRAMGMAATLTVR